MFNSGIIKYNICELCFKQLVKPNQLNCRNCQVKATNNLISSSNVFKIKYSKKPSAFTRVVDVTRQYIESKYTSKNLNDKRRISLIQYTHKVDNIHNYEWSNFQKIEQLD
ncbi:hypothetical protein CONCODRAFT_80949 [Conidiobolus coronatus NRRL 28638]|uniref:Uncharacterized protein n=1 Tax=Conidiobolus coronatus (strain ATCC 28846 / CBS 209.66 / NRRL 28638) TaxID=796925 RepID=A0A137NP61_CONC2|nr:hypothetical protein CONCODRAFT_80949 [Conidiobolus coronatus NRRL 28638]|eukprot:KXN64549.1 hypothetical protein CONCODRAFT_80949 [Conidiobolus coronatus NRRL 28638]